MNEIVGRKTQKKEQGSLPGVFADNQEAEDEGEVNDGEEEVADPTAGEKTSTPKCFASAGRSEASDAVDNANANKTSGVTSQPEESRTLEVSGDSVVRPAAYSELSLPRPLQGAKRRRISGPFGETVRGGRRRRHG